MSDLRTAAQQALEALDAVMVIWGPGLTKQANAMTALRAALAEPEQERHFCGRCGKRLHAESIHTCTPPGEA